LDSSGNFQRGPQSAQVSVLPLKVGRGRVGIPGNFRVLKEGENRTLDFLPQKTVTRLEVLRPVPCKYLETRLEKPVVVGMFRMPPSIKTHAVFSALSVKGCRVPNADSGISSVSWLKGKGYISPEVARGTQTLKKGLFNEYIYYI
jgi:hypothetical protein